MYIISSKTFIWFINNPSPSAVFSPERTTILPSSGILWFSRYCSHFLDLEVSHSMPLSEPNSSSSSSFIYKLPFLERSFLEKVTEKIYLPVVLGCASTKSK